MTTSVRRLFEQARRRAAELTALENPTEEQIAERDQQLDRAELLEGILSDEGDADIAADRLEALGELSRSVQLPGTPLIGHTREPAELSIGEYMQAAVHFMHGTITGEQFVDRAARYLPDEILDRATMVTADVAGIIPEPIVGPIIDIYDDRRRVWNSFTARTMPGAAKTFERPRVTQHVAVGEQSPEGDALTSQKMTLTSDTVTKRTFGGALTLTRQDIDWTEPSVLALVVADFMKVYTQFTETAAIAHLAGLATATSTYDATSLTTVVNSYVEGALDVSDALDDDVPLTLWMDTRTAAGHTKPVGSTDRTEWSVIREALDALDSEIRVVTSRRLPADTRIMGAGELVESYEQRHGLLALQQPTTLTTELGYSGYAAFHGIASGFTSIETV